MNARDDGMKIAGEGSQGGRRKLQVWSAIEERHYVVGKLEPQWPQAHLQVDRIIERQDALIVRNKLHCSHQLSQISLADPAHGIDMP